MRLSWVVFALALCLCRTGPASAQAGLPAMGAPAEMKALAGMDGTYSVELSVRPAPDAEWVTSRGRAVVETLLDGCVQRVRLEGAFLGMPMEAISLTAFNRSTRKWQVSWVDNVLAQISTWEGSLQNGRLVTTGLDHVMGMPVHVRSTSYDLSPSGWKWTMEQSLDGSTWAESVRAVYTRIE